jgi:membrane protein DedA with SNARE-associated domain
MNVSPSTPDRHRENFSRRLSAMSEATPTSPATPELPAVSANARRFVLIASGLLFTLGTVGSNLGPAWVDEHPAAVLALSSRNRNLFGSVPYIDIVPYALIGFTRMFMAGIALFFLGRWYGERAIAWTEKQAGELPALYHWFARAMDRAGWLVVIVFCASNLVWMMAGHRRMAPARYAVLLSIGIVIRLSILWAGGQVFEEQIRSFLSWIEDYQWYVVGGLFAVSIVQSARRAKRDIPEVVQEIEHPTEQ